MTQPSVQEVNYKDTLNLPVTSFQMKAGAAKREPELEAFWDESGVYEKAQALRKDSPRFLLHDGPPYLSSDKIHIGTALNKILKDIVTRYRFQRGFRSPYVPGYDGHGLPIENAVVKSIKGGRQAVTPLELRKRCREFAVKNLKGQEENFRRLGVWGNWEKPYLTIDAEFEAIQIKLFGEMYQKGYVYKGLKPVYWCPTCETALADAEVEYGDHVSHSIYVKFPFDGNGDGLPEATRTLLDGAALVIWTTTPWTLPANLALSVHPDFRYTVIQTANWGKLLVAKELLETFAQAIGLTEYESLGELSGHELEGVATRHPFFDRDSLVLTGTHVTLEAGTGVVHTAPGHGMEDYVVVQRHNATPEGQARPIPILSPVDNRGVFTADAHQFQGMHYEKAQEPILETLREREALLFNTKFSHAYPHCWRCHNPVIYRATEQWFIRVDDFRAEALKAIAGVEWVPARGEARITSMVEGRSDWCISRQRVWGVPIPVFYCANADCGHELVTTDSIEKVYELFKVHTSDVWWDLSAEQILGDGFKCASCGSNRFTKEMDIMDVWFDSGVTHTAVVEARKDELGSLPVELYLEGSDQHRGWFQSSLLTSVMLNGKAPYKSVLTHGFVLDKDGRKMSKSLGNVVDPQSITSQYGADVLRLWVASVDYTNDVRIGTEIVSQLAEVYKKVRNTARYMLGNLYDYNPATDRVDYQNLSLLDRFVLTRLQTVLKYTTQAFDQYEFHRFYQELQNFCVVDLSAFYFDVMKDTLYCDPKNSPARRGVQTVLHELLLALVRLLVPVTPHLAEDIWASIPEHQRVLTGSETAPVSVTLTPWPYDETLDAERLDSGIATAMSTILSVRDKVNKLLEKPRSEGHIGSSLEANLYLAPQREDLKQVLETCASILPKIFIVSSVSLVEPGDFPAGEALAREEGDGSLALCATKAVAAKCQRCWKYDEGVGSFADHPALCPRCHEAVTGS